MQASVADKRWPATVASRLSPDYVFSSRSNGSPVIANVLISAVPLIPVYLGIYLLFLMRNDFDLTLGGTFGVGGAVTAVLLINEVPVVLSMVAGVVVGGLLGLVTAVLHSRLKIPIFLAGLVMLIALYSVALRIMDRKPTIGLTGRTTILSGVDHLGGDAYYFAATAILGGVAILALIVVGLFLKTELGLAVRASGINVQMARSNGINDKTSAAVALFIGNGLAALSGSLVVQSQSFVAVSMTQGTVVLSGLGGVIIGSFIARPTSSKVVRIMAAVVIGALVYHFIVVLALELGLDPVDLNLVTAGTLVLAIAIQIGVRQVVARSRGRTAADFQPLRETTSNELINSISGKSQGV